MHYHWNHFMLSTTQPGVLDLWTHGPDGSRLCEEHIIAIRKQNLATYSELGW